MKLYLSVHCNWVLAGRVMVAERLANALYNYSVKKMYIGMGLVHVYLYIFIYLMLVLLSISRMEGKRMQQREMRIQV